MDKQLNICRKLAKRNCKYFGLTYMPDSLDAVMLLNEMPEFVQKRQKREKELQRSQVEGLAYEADIIKRAGRLGGYYSLPHLWIQTKVKGRVFTVQPDLVLLSKDLREVCVVEVKLRRHQKAFYQLFGVYIPVLRKLLGDDWSYRGLTVYKHNSSLKEIYKKNSELSINYVDKMTDKFEGFGMLRWR